MVYDSTNIVNIYANMFRTEWTNTDLRIRFGELLYSSSDAARKTLVVEERIGVTITWLRAKELRDQLNLLVTKYEEANGQLVEMKVISTRAPKTTDTTEPPPQSEGEEEEESE